MDIDILICTYNEGITSCVDVINPFHKNIRYIISHQVTDSRYKTIPSCLLQREDVLVSQINSRGISNNRNHALSLAKGDLCIIADDDVRYEIEEIERLISLYRENTSIDLIIGKIRTYEGEPDYKQYPQNPLKISKTHIGKVSSIEISFRLKSIRKHFLKFDNRFGIGGSLFQKGEESIFLSDCIDRGLKLFYFPVYLVKHPKISSTSHTIYASNEASYFGALAYRIFSNLAYFLLPVFMIKHHARYCQNISNRKYVKAFLGGIKLIKNTNK